MSSSPPPVSSRPSLPLRLAPLGIALAVALTVLARFAPAAATQPAVWATWGLGALAGVLVLAAPAGPRAALRRPAAPAALAALALAGWIAIDAVRVWHGLFILLGLALGAGLAHAMDDGRRRTGQPVGETLRLAALAALALWTVWPYCSPWLVGGGDARDYALHVADAVTQFRAGIFPAFVGQSDYAFNGDIHPLRTAPGMFYAAGLLDLLTARALTGPALQNLLIVANGLAAAYGAYRSLLRLAPERGWTAWLLAALFMTSPGILSGLYSGDMIATWMALPWLPPLFLCLIRLADRPDRLDDAVRGAALLAGVWLMHAPIGFWASVCAVPFGLWHAVRRWQATRQVLPLVGIAGVFGLLAAYVFVSALSLQMPADPNLREAVSNGAIAASLAHTWKGFFKPVSEAAVALLSDLQPSPGLWLALLAGCLGIGWHARASGRILIIVIGGLVLLLLPSSTSLWNLLPDLVLSTTEKWPAQRFFPILSAAIPFLALQALDAMRPRHARFARDLSVLLAIAAAWSLAETLKYHQRGRAVNHGPVATPQRFLPGNIQLSRYSHEYFGPLPRYFSHGPVEPQSELRLLARGTLAVQATNEKQLLAATAAPAATPLQVTDYGGVLPGRILVPPKGRVLFAFTFPQPAPEGVLQFAGVRLNAEYAVPASGEEYAFGAVPPQRPHLTLWNSSSVTEEIEVKFVRRPGSPGNAAGIAVAAIPYPAGGLPLELRGLLPLDVVVRSASPAWLETPRLFVPGYRARVGGQTVTVTRSPDGLVMVPVPAGETRVVVDYPGGLALRLAFWISAVSWVGFFVLASPRLRRPGWPDPADPKRLAQLGRIALAAAALGVIGVGVATALAPRAGAPLRVAAGGAGERDLVLPVGRPANATVRLLVVEAPGGPVELHAQLVDGKHVRLGAARGGGPVSFGEKLYANYLAVHRLRVRAAGDGAALEIEFDHRDALRIPAGPPGR